MKPAKKIIVSVSTDLSTDQRVSKVCDSLQVNGYELLLIGRKLGKSPKMLPKNYAVKRFKLWFNTGFLFYANLNVRLFFFLLFHKADVLLANDLDTLPANYWASKFKRIPLVYDSHEYFTEVPELENRAFVKRFWEKLEAAILPNLKFAFTVSSRIASSYQSKYRLAFKLVRNFPVYREETVLDSKGKVLLYQGALNKGRGLEDLIKAMNFVDEAELWLAGDGDEAEELKHLVEKLQLTSKVKFLGRLDPESLRKVTGRAKIGLSLEKEIGLNYAYALPNKIFDYLQAGTPVLYSGLAEVKDTLAGFEIGEELKSHDPKILAAQLNGMLNSARYSQWVTTCREAAKIFSWQHEEPILLSIFDEAFSN